MAENYRVAILRARIRRSARRIPDDVCAGVIIGNGSGNAVFQYWRDVTLGEVSFNNSRMFPWVDITIDAGDDEERSRRTIYRKTKEATEAAGHDLGPFDAFFVLAHPGSIPSVIIPRLVLAGDDPPAPIRLDAGATSDGSRGVAVLNSDSNHTFMCHELGHAIGWDHSFGLPNHGSDWDGEAPFTLSREYGDPYDLMSSATFGSRWLDPDGPMYSGSPAFSLATPPVAGWPGDAPWTSLGPGIAHAHLHRELPSALERLGKVKHVSLPRSGETTTVGLWPASHSGRDVTTLIAVHPPDEDADGRGRYYIEYRDTNGWDRGLETAETSPGDLARRAVVVHRLADAEPGKLRCWYQGRIVVPLEIDGDTRVPRLPLAIRVTQVGVNNSWVNVELVRTSARAVFLDRRDSERVVEFKEQRVETQQTLCGTLNATWGERKVVTTSTFTVRSYGFGGVGTGIEQPLRVQWTVAGKIVDPAATSLTVSVGGRSLTLGVTLDATGRTIAVTNTPDDGRYEVPVVATVTEADGRFPTPSSPAPYAVDGVRPGYDRSFQQQLRACIRVALDRLRIRPQEIFTRPTDPVVRPLDRERLERVRLEGIVNRAKVSNPTLAKELERLVRLTYDVSALGPRATGAARQPAVARRPR